MSWRELITNIYETRAQQPGSAAKPKFYSGAPARRLDNVEARLNARLPVSLRSLLLESNGVMEMIKFDGGRWQEGGWLLWTVAEIVKENLWCRAATQKETYKRDFSKLMFFADAGCDGILFGFPVAKGGKCAPRVVVWHPIGDELYDLAPSLQHFLKGWPTGSITVWRKIRGHV